jgi:hypothetical protein
MDSRGMEILGEFDMLGKEGVALHSVDILEPCWLVGGFCINMSLARHT